MATGFGKTSISIPFWPVVANLKWQVAVSVRTIRHQNITTLVRKLSLPTYLYTQSLTHASLLQQNYHSQALQQNYHSQALNLAGIC
jgi:hypothetical protein